VALISVVLGFNQTPVYTARPCALCDVPVYVPPCASTYYWSYRHVPQAWSRQSWPGW